MTVDDLNTPLGQDKHKRLLQLPVSLPQILAGGLGLFGLAVLGWAVFGNDLLGGQPTAVVATAQTPAGKAKVDGNQHARHDGTMRGAPNASSAVAKLKSTPPPGSRIITIIDGSSGQSHEVVIPGKSSDTPIAAPVDH